MVGQGCSHCGFRARYDNNPGSLLGRLWRWHAGWCPGWRKYMESLPEGERIRLSEKYKLEKFKKP
jgi:hypothetical protein